MTNIIYLLDLQLLYIVTSNLVLSKFLIRLLIVIGFKL